MKQNKILFTAFLASIAFGTLSMQSHAAAVFTDNSYVNTIGEVSRSPTSLYRNYDVEYRNYDFLDSSTGASAVSASVNYGVGLRDEFGDNTVSSSAVGGLKGGYYDSESTAGVYGYASSQAETIVNYAGEGASAYGRAAFDINFSIDTAYSYNLFNNDMGAFGNAYVYFGLYNNDTQSLVFNGEVSNGTVINQLFSGTLSAGSYNLIVESISDASGNEFSASSADFSLELTAVPIPAAIWLFASGLLGLAGFARCKTK